MSERSAERWSLLFARDLDAYGRPLPMSADALEAHANGWHGSTDTSVDISGLLDRAA